MVVRKKPGGRLPALELKTGTNHSPHVVILGAGASKACCPSGDAQGRPLPVMADLVRALSLEDVVRESGHDPAENFETIYSELYAAGDIATVKALDDGTRSYFESIRLPDHVTVYDYLLLSMRPKDMIVSFNWDPLLPQAYRRWRHLGDVLPEIIFPHGNVDLALHAENRQIAFACDVIGKSGFEPCRLLYPVEKKNYSDDPFIAEQWNVATGWLGGAYFVTVFGYSAPATDVEARKLLKDAWINNPTCSLGAFDVVDIRPKHKLERSWREFLKPTHGAYLSNIMHTFPMHHPRRTCEAFGFATLQQQPWREEPFPVVTDLDALEKWVQPLLEEEKTGVLRNRGLTSR